MSSRFPGRRASRPPAAGAGAPAAWSGSPAPAERRATAPAPGWGGGNSAGTPGPAATALPAPPSAATTPSSAPATSAPATAPLTGPAPSPPGPGSQRAALLRLAAVVAAIVAAAVLAHQLALLIVVASIVLMVMLHELGHFVTAKWSRMKVTEFFLGFGPRLWSVRRGETEYGIKAIPAGGYVKIVGMSSLEEVDPADEPRTYRQQPFHNRLVVAVAGSFMHFLTAFLLLWGALMFIGLPRSSAYTIEGLAPLAHGADPARSAGLQAGDVIVGVGGRPPASESALIDAISSHAGQPVRLTVERGGARRTVVVTPEAVQVPRTTGSGTTTEGRIGVEIGPATAVVSPVAAVGTAAVDFGRVVSGSVSGIQQVFSLNGLTSFFSQLGNPKAAAQAARNGTRPESIYGAVRTATQGAQAGPMALIEVLVAIDVFVGLVNLVPMLPLDGGHVVVAVYERIRSRRNRRYVADVAKLMPVAYAFILFLLVFVGSAVFLDITHPIANPFH